VLLNVDRARRRMAADGIDAWVCVLPKHVYYLSGYQSDWLFDLPWAACAILPRDPDAPATLIVHDVELTNLAESPTWMPQVRPYFAAVNGRTFSHYAAVDGVELNAIERDVLDAETRWSEDAASSCAEAACKALRSLGFAESRVAFDDLRFRDACMEALPNLCGYDAMPALLHTRQIKTDDELTLMREAARRNQQCIESTLGMIREGGIWADVRRHYCVEAARRDCSAESFFVGAGRKSMGLWADQHYPVPAGEPICLDAMLTYQRYFGDAQRTAVVGNPSKKLEAYWNAVSTAAADCYSTMRPGVCTADLRERAIRTVQSLGISHFRHAFVHGLGLDHLELPGDGRGFNSFTLEAGMVVNMDLEVCELGFGGIYFEQTMLITSQGSECLYSMPRELVRLA
jgi:Xaa-Pro dipeptidase